MRTPTSHRGVTLVELLIVVAVTLVVLAGAVVAANAQQRAYMNGQRLRGAQGSGRRALLALEHTLPSAGDGIDPTLAFDLAGWYAGGPCPAPMNGCPRDSVSNSDELVFYAREPKYWVSAIRSEDPVGNAWRIKSVTDSAVTVFARANDVFRKGQIFLAVCPTSSSYTYFTAAATVQVGATGAPTQIPLVPSSTGNPFLRQDLASPSSSCFNPALSPDPNNPDNPPHLFLVNRYRYHVRPVQVGSLGTVPQYDPILVLDRGVDTNLDGAVDDKDEELVAEGIESMQVTYGFYQGSLGEAGATPGSAVTFATGTAGTAANTITVTPFVDPSPPAPGNAYTAASFFPYTFGPPAAAQRLTNAQGNLQYVRVAFLARSSDLDTQSSGRADPFLPLMNQNALPSWITAYTNALGGHDGYQRVVLDTSISLPSMSNRGMTYF